MRLERAGAKVQVSMARLLSTAWETGVAPGEGQAPIKKGRGVRKLCLLWPTGTWRGESPCNRPGRGSLRLPPSSIPHYWQPPGFQKEVFWEPASKGKIGR